MKSSISIPLGWQSVPLSKIAEVRLGRQRSPGRAVGQHMRPYMRAANVTWSGIKIDDVKEMDFSPTEAEIYELKYGDILLAEASGSASEVGKPAIWRDEIPGACFQNTLIRIRAPEQLVPFLHGHFLNAARSGAFAAASRGVGIHHLGAQAMLDWQVDLPPLPEQRRLTEALDSYLTRLDAATAGLKRVEANLKRYRASVLKAAVEGRLVPTEAELAKKGGRDYEPASVLLSRILKERRSRWEEAELAKMKAKRQIPKDSNWKDKYIEPAEPDMSSLPVLPEGWCWARAEQVSEFITKGTTPAATEMHRDQGDIPYIKVYNLTFDGSLDFSVEPTFVNRATHNDFLARSRCQPGDVLMNIVGPPLGKVSVVPNDYSEWNINQAIARYRPLKGVDQHFLSLVLRSESSIEWCQRQAKATVGQFNLTLEIARDLPIPLAPLDEQKRIVDEEQRLLSLESRWLAQIARSSRSCQSVRQSILKWAFEGKLVDQDPNDEPASVLLERIRKERDAAFAEPKRAARAGKRKSS